MGKKKRNSAKKGGNRFFRWIRSDLPDEVDKKSPVLLLGVSKISDSPSFVRRRSIEPRTTGSIRFFRPPKSKYTRGLQEDERLERIRNDLLVHKNNADKYIPNTSHEVSIELETKRCLNLNCVSNCICDRKESNHGSFSFSKQQNRQSSLCPSEPYQRTEKKDYSENDIEFKYTEHIPDCQPSSSKQNSYNVTPKSADRRSFLLSNLNERFKKTLSLDSRKIETNRVPLSLPKETRPKSLVNTSSIYIQPFKSANPFVNPNFDKANQPKKKRKSFFSLDTFFDKKSDSSSVDDFCSSKYKRFELESDDSPLFRVDAKREKTPDLLNLPVIIDSVRKKHTDAKRQLEKLESHYYKSLCKTRAVIDAVPKDATNIQGPSGHTNYVYLDDDEVEYIEPFRSNFTSQSTLILDKHNLSETKPDSILTINTDETDIKLPSSTVSPKSNDVRVIDNDLDSIGAYEIEVKESDLAKGAKNLTVKIMDKSVDSIGSCSLDVDASTDFSGQTRPIARDTTSGSLNLLTPSSTTSRIRDFTSRIQERANQPYQTPSVTPIRTPEDQHTPRPEDYISGNLLKIPTKTPDIGSHRSRNFHKKRDTHKKPSYLNLACSVNGYTNLTTYDSKLRQDINKSREASPIRPITHTYQYRSEINSLLVPVPVGANKLLLPTFGPHDTKANLTIKAPTKALTDPHLPTTHAYMAAENKQLKNDFLGPSMTTTTGPYISAESKTFASSMLHEKDEIDNAKEVTFKSSYSEMNIRKTVSTNGKDVFNSEYTISSNGVSKRVEITKGNGEKLTSPMKSFIQQRVERLYGPGALAQGFLMQRHKKSFSEDSANTSLNSTSEIISPLKRFNESFDSNSSLNESESVSLPVLRHLRPEFRAQLPILSPKKGVKPDSPPQKDKTDENLRTNSTGTLTNGVSVISLNSKVNGPVNVDRNVNGNTVHSGSTVNGGKVTLSEKTSVNGDRSVVCEQSNGDVIKDAHYFLELEKKETERLLALSAFAERELESLQDQEVSEEVLGFLRAAAGKARLLATQKMQQFQGLCYNNINERQDEPFPTTVEDLQGFWDMVCLQVRNVDAVFEQLRTFKQNGWKESSPPPPPPLSAAEPPASSAPRRRSAPAQLSEKARAASDQRDAMRKALLNQRRRIAREKQLAARAGTSHQNEDMGIEGSQEVEIFIGKAAKPSKVAPKGDCRSSNDSQDSIELS